MSARAFTRHFGAYPQVMRRANDVRFTSTGCWEFPTGPTYRYAKRKVDGRYTFLHRLSLELALGKPLGKLEACHSCDNPPCINPAHLFAATHADNQRDMARKGRAKNRPRYGVENNKATLTDEQIVEALAALDRGETRTAVAARFGVTRRATSMWQQGIARQEALRRYRLREAS